ncbi:MAG TPA: amidohydrolase [Steroidobacteraceae bacterium]|jgi:hippurate hydrolase
MKNTLIGLAVGLALSSGASAQSVDSLVNGQLAGLVETYKGIHSHPELSHREAHTSALLAEGLRKAGYTVTEHVGKYPDGSQAYGVVAILANGAGPKLLIRADMDALPIAEQTGVSYASHDRGTNLAGQDVPVMHACGHDVHTTTLLGVGRVLAATKSQWHGTLMLIGQPSEETIDGSKAMLADHLYERFGTPDMAIALHDGSDQPAGMVAVASGPALAASTSVNVLIRGVGGHGAMPQVTKDPIVMAAEFIVQAQTIVSRRENPQDPAVVTVGDIHGGTKRNIIPTEVKLELTTRTFSDESRQIVIDGLKQTAAGVATAAGVPPELAPVVTVLEHESTPVMYNDPALAAKVKAALVAALGAANVSDSGPAMASEDFGVFGLEGRKIPTTMFWLGAANPEKLAAARAAGKSLPGPHTPLFQPDPEPTLRTGVKAMSSVAISLLK